MADHTHIEWTDATWNPITGCSVVSPGCTNCYAMKLAGTRLRNIASRKGLTKQTKAGPVWTGEVRFNAEWLTQPMTWKRPRRIFVCAHGDLFAEGVPDEWIDQIFAVMALAPQHTFQVLTKRPERMRAYLNASREARVYDIVCDMVNVDRVPAILMIAGVDDPGLMPRWPRVLLGQWPLPNVWLGTSVEDQRRADERIPHLLATPAALRFVSAEPLLGPVDLTALRPEPSQRVLGFPNLDALRHGWYIDGHPPFRGDRPSDEGIAWVIVGGESGAGARPIHPAWARALRDQCADADVAFFFKQWGAWAPICAMSEEQVGACYRSNRKARDGQDQSALDDIYGDTCITDVAVLHQDGSQHDHRAAIAFLQGTDAMTMFNIGKKAAGRLLDGREHNAMPGDLQVPLS